MAANLSHILSVGTKKHKYEKTVKDKQTVVEVNATRGLSTDLQVGDPTKV